MGALRRLAASAKRDAASFNLHEILLKPRVPHPIQTGVCSAYTYS
jgi:hypothetical protein